VRQGKALYVGVSNFRGEHFEAALRVTRKMNLTPITIHQPRYNLLGREPEWDLFQHTQGAGTGVIAYCPLASGVLTDKYLGATVPADSRAALLWGQEQTAKRLTPDVLERVRKLNAIAQARGQNLAQMALAWILHHPAVTSALIGASKAAQIEENVAALANLQFSDEELIAIDQITLS
jgi:L-glyceraldehyde 3-phosphate reductase